MQKYTVVIDETSRFYVGIMADSREDAIRIVEANLDDSEMNSSFEQENMSGGYHVVGVDDAGQYKPSAYIHPVDDISAPETLPSYCRECDGMSASTMCEADKCNS